MVAAEAEAAVVEEALVGVVLLAEVVAIRALQ